MTASVSAGSAVSVGSAVSLSSPAVGSPVSTASDASGVSLASSLGAAGATVVDGWLPPTIAVVANAAPEIRNNATSEVPIERIIRCVVFIASVSPVAVACLPVGLPSPDLRHRDGRRFQAVVSSSTVTGPSEAAASGSANCSLSPTSTIADASGWTWSRATRCTSSIVTASIAER